MNDEQNYQNQQNPYQNTQYQDEPYGQYNNGQYGNDQYNSAYQNYQQPYSVPPQLDLEEPVKLGEWFVTMLIMMIPCVNIVMMFVWAFSQTEKKSKSNFFKAALIVFGIVLALYLICMFALVALVGVSLY